MTDPLINHVSQSGVKLFENAQDICCPFKLEMKAYHSKTKAKPKSERFQQQYRGSSMVFSDI